MAILVTGGAGYIGSHTCVELLQAGYEIVVADNLVNANRESLRRVEKITGKTPAFEQVDLREGAATEALFEKYPEIEAVVHFAALKAVGESVEKPYEYYENNLGCTFSVLGAMKKHGVKRFVFSSSATVYGENNPVPLREDMPTSAINPYGATKLFNERILSDLCAADGEFSVALLRYFNPIGAHPSGLIGEDPRGIPNNLVPYIARVATGEYPVVRVFGDDYPTPDGTGVRDYIHVVDLAKGHVAALRKLKEDGGLFVCNLGAGRGYSVLEVISAYAKACGRQLPYEIQPRRAGDAAEVYADVRRAKEELHWQTELDLDTMCRDSWNWQSHNPKGYDSEEGSQ
ncbi:UDP-glucose 4-epimerase GalE [Ruminococcaceae bacterium OttesenSCG-928-I18]|nr:UDP-glucose 4-epimerase GalE [Ruminococcaceae bacterium OttesenSCG-928-I18]